MNLRELKQRVQYLGATRERRRRFNLVRQHVLRHRPKSLQKLARYVLHGGNDGRARVPADVREAAKLGIRLKTDHGRPGGTATGIGRGRQLSRSDTIGVDTLAIMRAWFARHGPDAINGGTSYRGYVVWRKQHGSAPKKAGRGAVAWLLWGGDPAYRWLKTPAIRKLLKQHFPKRKQSKPGNYLQTY